MPGTHTKQQEQRMTAAPAVLFAENKPKFPGVISNYISVIYDKNGSKP
jgi:hypothetical protein